MTTETVGRETHPSPERESFSSEHVGLRVRLLLGKGALNPENTSLPIVTPDALQPFGQEGYTLLQQASYRERAQSTLDKDTWLTTTVETFSQAQSFFQTEKGKAWSKLFDTFGVQTDGFDKTAAEKLYDRVSADDSIEQFVQTVLDNADRKPDGSLDYDKLQANLPAIRWLANVFGEKSAQIIRELIDAQAIQKTPEQRQALAAKANEQITDDQNTNVLRINKLNATEKDLLIFLTGNRAKEETLSLTQFPPEELSLGQRSLSEEEGPNEGAPTQATGLPPHEEEQPYVPLLRIAEVINGRLDGENVDRIWSDKIREVTDKMTTATPLPRLRELLEQAKQHAEGMEHTFSRGDGAWTRYQRDSARAIQQQIDRALDQLEARERAIAAGPISIRTEPAASLEVADKQAFRDGISRLEPFAKEYAKKKADYDNLGDFVRNDIGATPPGMHKDALLAVWDIVHSIPGMKTLQSDIENNWGGMQATNDEVYTSLFPRYGLQAVIRFPKPDDPTTHIILKRDIGNKELHVGLTFSDQAEFQGGTITIAEEVKVKGKTKKGQGTITVDATGKVVDISPSIAASLGELRYADMTAILGKISDPAQKDAALDIKRIIFS